jgi:hypothetical protein
MNKAMLGKLLWQQCVLRPAVQSIFPLDTWGRRRVVTRDWPWLVTARSKNALSLQNTTTGHSLELTNDHIHEYLENLPGRPGFLILKSQVQITRNDVRIEPILDWRPLPQIAAVRKRRFVKRPSH